MGNKSTTRWYDKHVRDLRSKEFYNSTEWKVLRQFKLNRDPLCEVCSLNEIVEPADMVHHLLPITTPEGWEHRFDLAFLQSLCDPCHNTIEAERDAQKRERSKGVQVHH